MLLNLVLLQYPFCIFISNFIFSLHSSQRQVVSLHEEADNPVFAENWKMMSRVEGGALMISYLLHRLALLPHAAQRYGDQSLYVTTLNHYILKDT